jgi:adenine-specific DNA methylase
LKARYRDAAEEARDRDRFAACRNRYAQTAGNDLRPWVIGDIMPRSDDIFQERLYAVQWLTPDGNLFFTAVRTEDIARDRRVEAMVRESLLEWQKRGLVPDSRIEPGDETLRLTRERGWTYWHHLFMPRHLWIGAKVREAMVETGDSDVRLGEAVGFARLLDYMSRLSQWVVGFRGRPGVAPSADFCCHVFYNQALNTFYNYGIRAFHYMSDALEQDVARAYAKSDTYITTCPANALVSTSQIWITDPPYADAIQYHEITEYFIAWLGPVDG